MINLKEKCNRTWQGSNLWPSDHQSEAHQTEPLRPACASSLQLWCLGKAVLCDCRISWVSSLIFLTFHVNPLLLGRKFIWNVKAFLKNQIVVLWFNDTSTLEGHFVSSPREREKTDRRESRGDEREGQGRKRNRNESEETEEIKTFPLYPYPLQG